MTPEQRADKLIREHIGWLAVDNAKANEITHAIRAASADGFEEGRKAGIEEVAAYLRERAPRDSGFRGDARYLVANIAEKVAALADSPAPSLPDGENRQC